MKTVTQAIQERRSVKVYDTSYKMSKEDITEILSLAQLAPSAWNLQHWKFKVFHSDESKQTLLPIAYNQSQISEASAVIAILGDLEAYKNVEPVFGPAVESGYMTQEIKDSLEKQITARYAQNEDYALHAAASNASLAAMQIMLLARERGLDTCAIGGFNFASFKETFNVSDRYVPVMLLTLGKAAKEGRPSSRLPIDTVIDWL